MPRKASRKNAKKQADQLFSKIVRARGECQAAGDGWTCGGPLQCCHVEGRANHRLRWEELNALCMCASHHRHYTSYPIAWAELVADRFPESYRFVTEHRNELWDRDLEAVMARLKSRALDLGL